MQEFLEALYGDLPEGAWWYLWTLPAGCDKGSTHWMQDIDRACSLAAAATDANVYYPVAWSERRVNGRTSEAEAAGIVALVADVDLRDDGKHRRAPETEEQALELIAEFPLRPTACVHSGHGLQCVWMFREPWQFDSDAERTAAKTISMRWAHTLTTIASKRSFGMDSVFDLARIMRLPGTVNVKDPDNPVPVQLLWIENDLRYNPADIEEVSIAYVPSLVQEAMPAVDISAAFPLAKHEALLEVHDGYRATWEHKRKDLSDQSASTYDFSLAMTLIGVPGFSDDEIAAVLREHQRRWGNKPAKVDDTRYYARTIREARSRRKAGDAREDAADTLNEPESDRDEAIQALATRFEVPLTNIQIVSGDPAQVRFWIAGRCAEVPATTLDTPKSFTSAMISAAGHYPRLPAQKERPGWREYVNIILRVAEPVEAGDEATVDGEFVATLRGFLDSRGLVQCPEGEPVKSLANPFRRGGKIWLRLEDLAQYMKVFDKPRPRREIVQRLRTIGGEPGIHKVSVRGNGETKTVRFYGIDAETRGVTDELKV